LRDDLPEVRRRMRAALESISLSPRRLGSRWQAAMTVYVLNREDAWFFLRRPLPGPPQTTSLCHAVDVDRLSLLQPRPRILRHDRNICHVSDDRRLHDRPLLP